MNKELIEKTLQPYIDMMHEAITVGWDKYNTQTATMSQIFSSRTKPNLIRDFIFEEIRKRVPNYENLRIVKSKGLELLVIDDEKCPLALRFKKLDKNLLAKNTKTQQAELFANQEQIDGFFPTTKYLNIGYKPNDIWTEIDCYIALPINQKANGFVIPMNDKTAIEKNTMPVITFEQADVHTNKPKIKIKDQEKGKKKNG